jgi:HEAT repeat protein
MRTFVCLFTVFFILGCGSEPSHNERGLSQWAKDLKSSSAPERTKAAMALGEIARREPSTAATVVPSLGEALKDSDADVRRTAAVSLGKQGTAAKSMAPNLRGVLADPESEVRAAAVQALADVDPSNADSVAAIVKVLEDKDLNVRRSAVLALGSMGPVARSAVPTLQMTLRTENDFEYRRLVADALASINLQK